MVQTINMMRVLSVIILYIVFCAFFTSGDTIFDYNDTVNKITACNLDYGVITYECDKNMTMITKEDVAQKQINTMICVCFEPNKAASRAGIGINTFNSWVSLFIYFHH